MAFPTQTLPHGRKSSLGSNGHDGYIGHQGNGHYTIYSEAHQHAYNQATPTTNDIESEVTKMKKDKLKEYTKTYIYIHYLILKLRKKAKSNIINHHQFILTPEHEKVYIYHAKKSGNKYSFKPYIKCNYHDKVYIHSRFEIIEHLKLCDNLSHTRFEGKTTKKLNTFHVDTLRMITKRMLERRDIWDTSFSYKDKQKNINSWNNDKFSKNKPYITNNSDSSDESDDTDEKMEQKLDNDFDITRYSTEYNWVINSKRYNEIKKHTTGIPERSDTFYIGKVEFNFRLFFDGQNIDDKGKCTLLLVINTTKLDIGCIEFDMKVNWKHRGIYNYKMIFNSLPSQQLPCFNKINKSELKNMNGLDIKIDLKVTNIKDREMNNVDQKFYKLCLTELREINKKSMFPYTNVIEQEFKVRDLDILKNKEYIDSDSLVIGNASFWLRIYPNGAYGNTNHDKHEGFVHIYLYANTELTDAAKMFVKYGLTINQLDIRTWNESYFLCRQV